MTHRPLLATLSALHDHPVSVAALVALLATATVAAAFALRWISSRMRSLFHEVLAVTLASLALGAIGAIALARLMILDEQQLGTVLEVLATTAVLATVLIVIAARRLGADVRKIELTLRRLETGDRTQRTEVRRADELGHVARALDELTERLDHLEHEREDYERERTQLLSSVSHDLRTPLAALQVSIEAIADGLAPDPDRYIRSMKRDIQAISALVDDLFLLARIEHDELPIDGQPFDLAEIADESIEALEPVATAQGLRVELANSARVRAHGSPTAIGRVIRNLIDNAIRHAPTGSTIVVSVSADDGPMVRVVDQGPGFPPEFATHAFEQFTRADTSRSRTTGGSGLGLAIARGLVEAHGGRIWIEASTGGDVAFALPAA
jgi:signal transduction histidine kinase